jgi:hypothetical protein
LLAVGHDDGLWIGLRYEPSTFRRVLPLKNITQCAVLQEFRSLLVLGGGILFGYSLDAIVTTRSETNRDSTHPERLSGSKEVLFFKVGKVGARTLVIYVKKSGVNQTVFKALEPVGVQDRSHRGGFMRRKPES